ncbi:MAG TPA: galactokinase [Gemmatimonadaceae bacterium]|nr:galactokinase [Gemmatimonadaceae bacterium]
MSATAIPPAASPADGAEAAASLFSRTYGTEPAIVASAPGRINLIGEHVDYAGGQVLPLAIGRRTHVAIRANGLEVVRALSSAQSEAGQFPLRGARPEGKWWDYVAGIFHRLDEEGVPPAGADIAVWADLPPRAGLRSSAALLVAAALAVSALSGHRIPLGRLAAMARRAEEEYVGVGVGIMDHLARALAEEGQALHIWCDGGRCEPVPFRESVLVFDTRVPRALRASAFNARRAEAEAAFAALRARHPALPHLAAATPDQVDAARLAPPLDRRARHIVSETRRVEAAVAALRRGELLPGALLAASHASLRDDYECSCAELDWFVERITAHAGVRGARLTGAGWGGAAIAVGDREALERAAPAVAEAYRVRFRRTPRWWVTAPAAGPIVSPYRNG